MFIDYTFLFGCLAWWVQTYVLTATLRELSHKHTRFASDRKENYRS
jgi:hypothetical protein